MTTLLFTPGETYRIQNVEQGTFLELYQSTVGSPLALRPHKEFSEKQQWTLESFPSREGFVLQNVSASRRSNGSPTYITYDGLIVLDPTQAASISLESLEAEHLSIKLLHQNGSAWRLLWANTLTTVHVRDHNGSIQLPGAEDSNKWRLIPVWPSLPGGPMYTIRNVVSGLALNMNTMVSPPTSPLAKRGTGTAGAMASPPQLWQVEPLLNGRIHLKNTSLDLFLRLLKDDPDPSLGDLIGSQKGEPWQLTRVGGVGYTITIQPPQIASSGKVTFALTILEGSSQIILAPSNEFRNQVWFFEWAQNRNQPQIELNVGAGRSDGSSLLVT